MIPLLLILLLARLALLTPSTSQELEVRGHRTQRDTKQDSIKVVISEGCVGHDGSSDSSQGGKEIELAPGSPLVLTHKIKLVPSGLGPGSGSCDCEADLAALRERVERLEREVSALREKCGGAEGGCCSSKESKGAGCSIKPNIDECPNECSDQGRCVDGKCVCFPGFSGPDCSDSNCPGNCNNRGRCVNGQCVCDPGFSGPDCSEKPCPGNCNNRGRCVNGQCVCNPGFTGPDCSKKACPDNCNNRGRCVNGKCVCDSGYTGANCAEIACPGNCNNRGRCVNGQCFCNPGFTGPDCSKKACPDNCNNRGRCVNGQCFCNPGFTGPDCSKKACPDNCNNRGRCVNGQCVCDDGFGGPDCSEKVCPNDCSDLGRCIDGRCVCDSGFTGDDCSEEACPGNCNNRGRCVNGQCVCNPGFTGPDCSKKACPDNCNNRGRCVNGKCVCDSGYTGANCAEIACPGNCNNRGRCVNGQCVCDDGFTGADCSEKSCPNNCSNKGKCVNGKCVCNAGFAAPDCAAKSCPNNCSNKGRCIKGRCLCRRGFTGPDCSQCEDGMTGPNCDTAMSGVSQLRTQDITETSVTLVWTPPPVQYESYLITFRSQKESDQQITSQVQGSLTTFTQTGLAAGQEYSVTITGEVDGRKGAESSSEFMTLISSPTNLKVVKTTSTSAVVQWEKSQGEIDRYRLTITPSDGSGTSEELSVPANQDSAHIKRLEAGRLYDIVLVAEKGNSQSQPANTQAVPGKTLPKVARRVPQPPGQVVRDLDKELRQSADDFDQNRKREADAVRPQENSSASVVTRTKPLVNRMMKINGTKPKLAERPFLSRKPKLPSSFRFNTTRAVPGVRKVGHGPLKKPLVVQKKKEPIMQKKPKPGVPKMGNRTTAPTVKQARIELSSERKEDKNPATASGTDPDAKRQSSSEEPKEQPDVGPGKDAAPPSSEPTGPFTSQETKCLNKIKVTHIRFPLKDRSSGCRGEGTVLLGDTSGSDQRETPAAATDPDSPEDPLHQLLRDTYGRMNVSVFSVHLSRIPDLPDDAQSTATPSSSSSSALSHSPSQAAASSSSPADSVPASASLSASSSALPALSLTPQTSPSSSSSPPSSSSSPPTPSSSSSSSSPPTPSSSSSSSPPTPSSSSSSSPPTPSSSSSSSPTTPSSSSSSSSSSPSLSHSPSQAAAPSSSLTDSLQSSSSSSSSSTSDRSDSDGSNELGGDDGSPEERQEFPSREGGAPLSRHTPPKQGFIRRRPNFGPFHNRNRLNLRVPQRSSPRPLSINPGGEPDTRQSSTDKSSSSSDSDESLSVEVDAPAGGVSGDKDAEKTTPVSSEEQNQKQKQTERGRVPVRRPLLKGGFIRRPFLNRTRPNSKLLTHPAQLLNPKTETEQKSPSEYTANTSDPAEGSDLVGSAKEDNEGRAGMRTSNEVYQRPGGSESPVGFFRRTQLYGGPFQNRTRPNLRQPQYPHRGPLRKPFPVKKLNGAAAVSTERQNSRLQNNKAPKILETASAEQDVPGPTQTGERGTVRIDPSTHVGGHDATAATGPDNNQLGSEENGPLKITNSEEEDTNTPDLDSEIPEQRHNADETTEHTDRGKAVKQTHSASRASRPATLPRKPQTPRPTTEQRRTPQRPKFNVGQKRKIPYSAKKNRFQTADGIRHFFYCSSEGTSGLCGSYKPDLRWI
ncbi:mucin-5AC isoform X1 [Echeneis naucrates]|uniref:mucin-5AC isoform X1 n=1 Tax=Echeneis naucrates TaxID=173247 RepID=UPI0011132FF3|nr:mucin-5AC-like isoform X1 [Echeneis naucrates]